jgi:hypothetical protein
MIIDPRGRLVWFHQLTAPVVATNFRPQFLAGRRVLTWWQGKVTIAAYGLGAEMIYDTSYRPLRVVRAGNGYAADLHEFVLTRSGDALLTVQSLILRHRAGTAPGTLSPFLDSIVQEVDVRTGLVVWEWHALGHIPVADSYVTAATSPYFDAYHINSIELVPGGRVLISARDTSALSEIDQATGRLVWTLGGKASSFRMGPGARFYFQHDARLLSAHRVSLFDDEGGPPFYARSSRGLILRLDLRRRTTALVRQYRRPGNDTLAASEGSVQTVAGGGALVGFGSEPYFSEFGPGEALWFDAHLPAGDGSYRVFGAPWTATPATRPSLTVKRTSPPASRSTRAGTAPPPSRAGRSWLVRARRRCGGPPQFGIEALRPGSAWPGGPPPSRCGRSARAAAFWPSPRRCPHHERASGPGAAGRCRRAARRAGRERRCRPAGDPQDQAHRDHHAGEPLV